MKNWLSLVVFNLIILLPASGQELGNRISVGIVADSRDFAVITGMVADIRSETSEILGNSYKLEIREENIRYCDWQLERARQILKDYLDDPDIEIVVGVGIVSSAVLGRGGPYPKPVIAANVINPKLQEIPLTLNGTSGVKNLSYSLSPFSPERDIEVFQTIFSFKRLGVLIRDVYATQSLAVLQRTLAEIMGSYGISYQMIPIGPDVVDAVRNIPNEVDAIYIAPVMFDDKTKGQMYQALIQRKYPSFAMSGRNDVELGALAGIAPPDALGAAVRRVAVNIQKISSGIDAEDISVNMNFKEHLTLNMETARRIGYSPTWNVLNEAELINEELTEIGRTVNLKSVILEALAVNWKLILADQDVLASEKNIPGAKSALLPQMALRASARQINAKRAQASFGSNPERLGVLSTTLSQVIYSEQANANLKIQRIVQQANVFGRDVVEQDVTLLAAEAYLFLMQAKTFERIQRQNLALTRKNLELARIRQQVGYSGPSDLYRWESEIALVKIELNNTQAIRRNAEINLNQILRRSQQEPFVTEEVDLNDPDLITNDPRLDQYVKNPKVLEQYTEFMVQEGISNLPEIKRIDALIEAQKREVLFNRRNFYQPNFGVDVGLDYSFFRDGAGSEPTLVEIEDLNWSIGLGASVPIITGGKRQAFYQQSSIELQGLEYERRNLINLLEQRVRSKMELVGASYANIEQSNAAAQASKRNFDVVQDSYSQGVVSIIQLIDGQNAYLESQFLAVNSIYQFVIDVLNVERSIGLFYTLSSPEQRDDYFRRLDDFTNQ